MENLARLAKEQREKRKLSLRVLARQSGVSAAMISRIEQGHASPSFETLRKILSVFGLSFAEFFQLETSSTGSPIIPKSRMKIQRGLGHHVQMTVVNSGVSGEIQMFREEYGPGGHSGPEPLRHESIEMGLCIQGRLVLELAGKKYDIGQGDGWCFDSRLPHRFLHAGKKKAVLVSANTPAVL